MYKPTAARCEEQRRSVRRASCSWSHRTRPCSHCLFSGLLAVIPTTGTNFRRCARETIAHWRLRGAEAFHNWMRSSSAKPTKSQSARRKLPQPTCTRFRDRGIESLGGYLVKRRSDSSGRRPSQRTVWLRPWAVGSPTDLPSPTGIVDVAQTCQGNSRIVLILKKPISS
jgi:hypothetical protein